jgi:hypothetical protein
MWVSNRLRSIPHAGKDWCGVRNAPRWSDALRAVLFDDVVQGLKRVLGPIRIPAGRLVKPLLGKIQKGLHLRWHHAMRWKVPEYNAALDDLLIVNTIRKRRDPARRCLR